MNIRIKELFKSDLDPNSNEWWSKDKIDKINFNFNLLRNGGPQGPMGTEGPNGIEGDKGEDGVEGNQGPYGAQGLIGPESEGTWKSYDIGDRIVIYPSIASNINGITIPIIGASSHQDGSGNLISPYYGTAATIPINLAGSGAINILNEGPMSIPGFANYSNLSSIQVIENLDYSNSFNFGLTSFDNGAGNTAVFEIKPSYNNTSPNLQEIKFKGDIRFNFISNGNINTLGSNSTINYPLQVNATDLGQTIEFTVGQLKFNQSASLNNILKSNDTLGTVTWENVSSLFSVLPIGSIVRIPSTDFNSSNFYTDDANTINNGPIVGGNGVYDIRTNFGAGKIDGMFAGWYLCIGEKWGDGGIITYDTPNLNGFSYQFSNIQSENYGNSAPASGGNSHSGNILYSGSESNINMNGATIEQTNSSSDSNAYLHNANYAYNDTENHVIFGEQVSIIFLGEYNYVWSNYDPNLTTSDISLSYHQLTNSMDQDGVDISMRYAASLQPEVMQWTADISPGSLPSAIDAYWINNANFNNQGVSTGIRVYDNGVEVNSGWFFRAGSARYYQAGVGFTGDATLVVNHECWMLYGEAVNDVDGNTTALFPNTAPLSLISESDISNNNTLDLQEMYVSSNFENSPLVSGSPQDLTEYEQNTHIWTVNSSNNIVVPTTGWYRSIPYSDSYDITYNFLGNTSTITIQAGHILGYRKYWNQNDNEFKGDTIKDGYVPWSLGGFRLASGSGANSIACTSGTGHDIFFSIDSIESGIAGNTSAYEVQNFTSTTTGGGANWTFNKLYVRADSNPQTSGGSSANKGKYPLREVKSDTYIPGTSTNLVIAKPLSAEYKEINTSSMAPGSILSCPIPLTSSGVYFSISANNFVSTTINDLFNLGAEFIPRGSANSWQGNGGQVKSVNYYVTGNNPSTSIDVDVYTVEINSTQTSWIDQNTNPNPSGIDWMWADSFASGSGGQGMEQVAAITWTDSNGPGIYTIPSGNVMYKSTQTPTYQVGSDSYDIYFEFNESPQWEWPTGIYNGTWPHECVKVHFVPTITL